MSEIVAESLLHLDSSISRSGDSVSRQLTTLFAATWRERHGTAGYTYRDLAVDPIPPVTGDFATLGQRVERHGFAPPAEVPGLIENAAEHREWELTRPLLTEVLTADTVLAGVPMYNFSVPAAFKAWIDRVGFPGAFTEPGTRASLLRDTRVVIVTARGGAYGPGSPREGLDFQVPFLRAYFRRLGVAEENLRFVYAELTRAADIPQLNGFRHQAAASLEAARADVTELAGGALEVIP
jgi:FMN-dependent NADH-azoreductase